MKKDKTFSSQELGLGIAVIGEKYFLKTDYLHFGYWPEDLEIDLSNLPKAQENHSNFIISRIPEGIKIILDVGCGTGRLALDLIYRGYTVDCLSPSSILTQHARELLGNKSHIFECRYEELQTEKKYDLILFSESFQYVNLVKSLQKSIKLLNDNGYLLICDYFKTDAEGKSALGGGHKLTKFYDFISQYPFKVITNIDITKETAPNLEIVDNLLANVGSPICKLFSYYLNSNYPRFSKLLQWIFKKKIQKLNYKYFSGERNSENFAIFKSYRFLLYQMVNSSSSNT